MSTSWDPNQKRRVKLYEELLPKVRSDPLILRKEIEIAVDSEDKAHMMAVKDIAITLFLEASLNPKMYQTQYADAFNNLQIESERMANKTRTEHVHGGYSRKIDFLRFSGFFESLYGSLIVRSSFEPSEVDLAFITHASSYEKTLRLLYTKRLVTPTNLAEYLAISPQRGSQILKELEDKEIVHKLEKVGRSQFYRLTQSGITLAEHLFGEKYLLKDIWNSFICIVKNLLESYSKGMTEREVASKTGLNTETAKLIFSIIKELGTKEIEELMGDKIALYERRPYYWKKFEDMWTEIPVSSKV